MGEQRLSRFLAKLLRHDAKVRGLDVTPEGYVNIEDILGLSEVSQYSETDVENVVRNDRKGRFQMRTHGGRSQIKATQGHSFQLSDSDLTPINHHTEARMVLHGTRAGNWPSIKASGLSRKRRAHIHFAPGENNVKSGFPPYCDIAIEIDLEKALRDGLKFYKSSNDVILSSGDHSGFILPKYFRRAYNIRGTRESLPLD